MTVRALGGLVALNVFVLATGFTILWGLRGWRWWTDLFRLAGVAYLLGVGAFFLVFTLELVAGIPFGLMTTVMTGVALGLAGLALGRSRCRSRPGLRPSGWRFPRPSLLSAFFAAAIVVYLEALFRSGRLQGPGMDWDSWRVWTLRAKGIFYTGGLDETMPSLNPSYPPGLSAMQAATFHAMGSVDVVTLHLLNWFFTVGFVAAVIGLLASRVRAPILLPSVLLLLVMPGAVPEWGTWLMADLPMGYLLVLSSLLLVFWLEDRRAWRLAAVALLLAGVMVTKREGVVLALVVVVAALLASSRDARRSWPPLAASGLAAFALALPWRIWFTAHGLESDAPETGYFGFLHDLDRGWPSLKLVVRTLFDYDLWLVVPALGLVAVALALLAGERRLPFFVLGFLVASIAGSTWVIWAIGLELTQDYSVNPVGRLMGTTVLVLAALTPLLLERAWRAVPSEAPALLARLGGSSQRTAAVGWAVVVVALLGYPGSMLAGTSTLRLPGGLPAFPSPDDCVRTPVAESQVRLVFGYEGSYREALALRERAVAARFPGTSVEQDGCGRLRVFYDDVPSAEAATLVARAESTGLPATLEARPALTGSG